MTTENSAYTILRGFYDQDPNIFLVRRTTDGEIFVGDAVDRHLDDSGGPIPYMQQLIARGAGDVALRVLNHENLVSVHGEIVTTRLYALDDGVTAQDAEPISLLLWDYCDAGTLEDLFKEPPVPVRPSSAFLPEGLIWHVCLGLLRALQWLHEGVREKYQPGPAYPPGQQQPPAGAQEEPQQRRLPKRCTRVRQTLPSEPGWSPILHRGIFPESVFLQQPRGIETYGAVKLGGLQSCVVTGASVGDDIVVGTSPESDGLWLLARIAAGTKRENERSLTPSYPSHDLYAVGAILYRMATGRIAPPRGSCPRCRCEHLTETPAAPEAAPRAPLAPAAPECTHQNCPQRRHALDITRAFAFDTGAPPAYTEGLKTTIQALLRLGINELDNTRPSHILREVWPRYIWWTTRTPDGRLHRDIYDDIWFRKRNLEAELLRERAKAGGEGAEKDGDVKMDG